jgi:hypothetical protein
VGKIAPDTGRANRREEGGMTPSFAAIPTIYRGAQFRSRLEARWAAFFDLAGWRWDYEPCDFDGWIPDFVLFGAHGPIYVEVKPTYFTHDDVDKVETLPELEKVRCCKGIDRLILGNGLQDDRGLPVLGVMYLAGSGGGRDDVNYTAYTMGGYPANVLDFITTDYKYRIGGQSSLDVEQPAAHVHAVPGAISHNDIVQNMWLRAGAMTQWKQRKAA